MWSGPRNISTAMMRAWGNRPDTVVIDEPFYAFYLQRTGADHPAAEEVIATGETDWRKVVARLTAEAPGGKRIFYSKQMTHHLLPEIERDWLDDVTNCFLIRDPAAVITSYIRKNHDPSAEDVGFPQQAELFDLVCACTGRIPPVIDAGDVLDDPRRSLSALCVAVGVEFSEAMLSWPPGLRDTDGVWAKHWYTEVANSTEFQPPKNERPEVPERLSNVHAECAEIYERLRQHRL
jgi:hypothetical protein